MTAYSLSEEHNEWHDIIVCGASPHPSMHVEGKQSNLHSSVLILLPLLLKVKKLNYCDVLYSVIIILMHIEGK